LLPLKTLRDQQHRLLVERDLASGLRLDQLMRRSRIASSTFSSVLSRSSARCSVSSVSAFAALSVLDDIVKRLR
jgi:hypothetical protein